MSWTEKVLWTILSVSEMCRDEFLLASYSSSMDRDCVVVVIRVGMSLAWETAGIVESIDYARTHVQYA
jgi:hypothetical protein